MSASRRSVNSHTCHCVGIGMLSAVIICKCMYGCVYFKMEIIDVIVWTPWAISKSAVNNSSGARQFTAFGGKKKKVCSCTLIKHMWRGCLQHVNVAYFKKKKKKRKQLIGSVCEVLFSLPELILITFLPWSQRLLSWLLYFSKTKWHGSFPEPPNRLFPLPVTMETVLQCSCAARGCPWFSI